MKRIITTLVLVFLSAPLWAQSNINVWFSGSCKNTGNFDVQQGDIEFFNLNLDTFADSQVKRNTCVINAEFSSRNGYYLDLSWVQVEALGSVEEQGGGALLSVAHRTNNSWSNEVDDVTREVGETPLLVKIKNVAKGVCNHTFRFDTRIELAAKLGFVIQEQAINTIGLGYEWKACNYNHKVYRSKYHNGSNWVSVDVFFDGTSGWFKNNNFTGKFYNVHHKPGKVYGLWNNRGSKGWFEFNFTGTSSFKGRWGYGNKVGHNVGGNWNGWL